MGAQASGGGLLAPGAHVSSLRWTADRTASTESAVISTVESLPLMRTDGALLSGARGTVIGTAQ